MPAYGHPAIVPPEGERVVVRASKRSVVVVAMLTGLLVMVGSAVPANPAASADQATGFRMNAANDGSIPDAGLNGPLAEVWSTRFSGPLSSQLIANGMVFVTSSPAGPIKVGTLYALNQETGSIVWSRELGTNGTLAYDRGRVFVRSSTSYAGLLTAYDA